MNIVRYTVDMNSHQLKESGFMRLIIFLIVAIILASYFFKFDIKRAVEDPQTQSNFGYLKEQGNDFYFHFLKKYFQKAQTWIENAEKPLSDSDTTAHHED